MSEFTEDLGIAPEEHNVTPEGSLQETFSFFDVLEERTYPEDKVTVSIDEAAGYELSKLANKLRELRMSENASEEDYKAVEKQADELKERLEASQFTFYLKGISDDSVTDAIEVVDGAFEKKKTQVKAADGTIVRKLPESESMNYARYLNAVVLSLHVQRIVRHKNGSVMVAPSPDEIANFFDKAPSAAKERINTAMQSLRVASSSYEATLDEGFFLKP